MAGPLRAYFRDFLAQRDRGFTEAETERLVTFAFERYFTTSALLGSAAKCSNLVDALERAGADELACLIDFGLELSAVLDSLERLARMMNRRNAGHVARH